MVVFRRFAGIAVAELKHDRIVDRELQCVAHLLVVIGLVGDVGARDDRRSGDDFRGDCADAFEDRHIVGGRLVVGVDFAGLER